MLSTISGALVDSRDEFKNLCCRKDYTLLVFPELSDTEATIALADGRIGIENAATCKIRQIVSGGQTGADRAALDWALLHGVPHAGWCPKGRLAVDGPLPAHYQLRETASAGYRQRTRLNVECSDATLVLNTGPLDGGTLQTVRFAKTLAKPHLVIQLDEVPQEMAVHTIQQWLMDGPYPVLNVAGPREEKRPGIYARVSTLLDACFPSQRCIRAPEIYK